MRILIVSHANGHPRQWIYARELSKSCDVKMISPDQWIIGLQQRRVEIPPEFEDIIKTLPTTIIGDWWNSIWIGIEDVIKDFKPDWIYCWEEWHSFFVWQLLKLAKKYNVKFLAGGWENIFKRYPSPYNEIEQEVLLKSDLLQAGNSECMEILIKKGADPDSIIKLPQVGVPTDHMKPMNIEKDYDTVYIGNHLPWKGCPYIDSVVRELGLKHLWVGEGSYQPQYGDISGYGNYLDLPKYYNRAKFGIHFSLKTPSWKEQFNYVSNECLACGLPVVVEKTRIMEELFSGCEAVIFVREGDVKSLREKVWDLDVRNIEDIKELGLKGREFVKERWSNEVVAKRLIMKLKEVK